MKLKQISIALSSALIISAAQAGGIPTFDGATIAQMITAIKVANAQKKKLEDTFTAQNGATKFADLLDDPGIREQLPDDFLEILDAIKDGDKYKKAREKYGQSNNDSINKMWDQKATAEASLDEYLEKANSRIKQLESLQKEIVNAINPKEKADLANRFQAEANNIKAQEQVYQIMQAKHEKEDVDARHKALNNFTCKQFGNC